MAKDLQVPVAEQTATLSKVGALTQTFLGLAIGMGFIAAAAPLFIPIDSDGAKPLKVAQVVNVKSIMNQDDSFVEMKYFGGTTLMYDQTTIIEGVQMNKPKPNQVLKNQVLKIQALTSTPTNTNSGSGATSFSIETIGNTNSGGATSFSIESIGGNTNSGGGATSFSIESIGGNTNSGGGATSFSIESIGTNTNGGATSFSIEPVPPQSGVPAQMAVMEYKLATDAQTALTRKLTICIGRTSVTSLYVGTDGSTYANSSFGTLNGRTTNESCATIKNRAMKVTQITGGTMTAQPGDYAAGDYQFIRAFIPLARFSDGQFVPNTSFVTLQTEAPLYAGFTFMTSDKPAAPAIFTLNGKYGSITTNQTVCFPETTMNPLTGGPVYYFDNNGTPFYDIFLQTRAMTANCGDIVAKGLRPTSVERATTTAPIDPTHGIYLYSQGQLKGVIDGSTWTSANNNEPVRTYVPLTLALGGGTGTDVINVPQRTVTMEYNLGQKMSMCFPSATSVSPGKHIAYYDTNGKPYKDLFLSSPYACSDYQNIHVISKTSSSATIGWDTPRTTCSNINYGTVVNQLNSEPVNETAPCSGPAHQATITGLASNTTYLYEIVGVEGAKSVVSGQQTFTTATAVGGGGGGGPIQIPIE